MNLDSDKIKRVLPKVMNTIIKNSDEELFAKKQFELDDYWHWKWEPKDNLIYNTYRFFDRLKLYGTFVRRWEEHHNGICCVVERVRDKYLLPKIAQFYLELKNSNKEDV